MFLVGISWNNNKIIYMVKRTKKASKTSTNTINSILTENKTLPKSKKQIDKEYYQKNKERKKTQQKERYQQQKEQSQQALSKYYEANSIQILINLKDYTELNKEKQKL